MERKYGPLAAPFIGKFKNSISKTFGAAMRGDVEGTASGMESCAETLDTYKEYTAQYIPDGPERCEEIVKMLHDLAKKLRTRRITMEQLRVPAAQMANRLKELNSRAEAKPLLLK